MCMDCVVRHLDWHTCDLRLHKNSLTALWAPPRTWVWRRCSLGWLFLCDDLVTVLEKAYDYQFPHGWWLPMDQEIRRSSGRAGFSIWVGRHIFYWTKMINCWHNGSPRGRHRRQPCHVIMIGPVVSPVGQCTILATLLWQTRFDYGLVHSEIPLSCVAATYQQLILAGMVWIWIL